MDAKVETKERKGGQQRGRIGPDDVKGALAAAGKAKTGDDAIHDLNDTDQPYLTLRRRGKRVSWLVRAYKQTKIIGAATGIHVDPTYLTLRAAREKSKLVYAELSGTKPTSTRKSAPGGPWTWADLDREYQDVISKPRWINNRSKPSSKGTCDDVRLAFARPSFQAMHGKRLTKLDRPTVYKSRDAIESYRQRQKNIAYFKAAMTWAADEHPDASGLTEKIERWWEHLNAGSPDVETQKAIEERRAVHRQSKAALDVEAIAKTLVAHEAYCAGRTPEDRISPGVRWGIWWVSLTANRRSSTVQLRRDDFHDHDPLGEKDWGRAAWPPDAMKAKVPFWLPLPPFVRDVALGSMAEWQNVVNYGRGANNAGTTTAWVFASQQRQLREKGGNGDFADISVYPNSLNRYLQRMRADGALKDLPLFNPHLVRSAMGGFIEEKVSGVVASLVLAHTLPDAEDEAAPTTKKYYLLSQRMKDKTEGMRAWTDALIEAYLKIPGAKLPKPNEHASRIKTKKAPG